MGVSDIHFVGNEVEVFFVDQMYLLYFPLK
jgi:hypothetical protein